MKNIVPIIVGCGLLLSGCASTPERYVPRLEEYSAPAVNTVAVASVGETMLSQGVSTDHEGVMLLQPATRKMMGSTVSFSPGFYLKTGNEGDKILLRAASPNELSNEVSFGRAESKSLGITTDLSIYVLVAIPKEEKICYRFMTTYCASGAVMEVQEHQIVSPKNFQQTLIYNGRVGDRINIGYREFKGDFARAPFSNEVEYDLSDSDVISYKGASIRILKADNSSITYEILKNFN